MGQYDTQAQLVYWLLHDEYRYAGKSTEVWDGLDQWGNPLAAETYPVKVFMHVTLTTEYSMTQSNPGTSPDAGDWLCKTA